MGAERQPRFFPEISIPSVPDGMIAVRFHGSLAFIPATEPGEPLDGNSRFTKRQHDALSELEDQRIAKSKFKSDPRDLFSIYAGL